MARLQAAAAASGELPGELRARADRSWRVCRFGAVVTTVASLVLVGGVLVAVAWVERESRSDHPADWYFMAPILAAVFGGWLVAAFNGAVGLICALMTPLSDD